MSSGAIRAAWQQMRAVAIAILVCAVSVQANLVHAQVGPVAQGGYLEYQFRMRQAEDSDGSSNQHLATWRGQATTFVWRPYILLLNGNLGLTRTRNADSRRQESGTIVTGALAANVFARSSFPFRIYFESRDSRVDGDVFDRDFSTRNWGFLQQLASRRNGGRLSLEYRRSDTDEISINGRTEQRNFGSELWQLTGQRAFERNDFNLVTSLRKLTRDFPAQTQDRALLNLRHRFRGNARFSLEDRLFYSDEKLSAHGSDQQRQFLQFSGYSQWRPETKKPLLVTGRLIAQGTEAGNGTTRGRQRYVVSGSANYQYSPQVSFAASASINGSDGDDATSETGSSQRLRGSYRSQTMGLAGVFYRWGGSLDVANRLSSGEGDDSVQAIGVNFNQGLTRNATSASGRSLQFGLTQSASATASTQDNREQRLTHTAYLTLSSERGRASGYLRLSASDQRRFGDRPDESQMLSLQASSRMQINSTRSLNGSISLQYFNAEVATMMNGDTSLIMMSRPSSFSYSAFLSYRDVELFGVRNLYFLSQLRYLSSDFRSDNVFDTNERLLDPDRSDSSWRNELTYRIGLLELRLLAEIRDLNGTWNSQAFFSVRRYYGAT